MPKMTFEVIDAAGEVHRGGFPNSQSATAWAESNMPGPQDTSEDANYPNGWAVQTAGATPADVQVVGAGDAHR